MVKRFVAFGSAVLLALSLSVSAFAASPRTYVPVSFPYFGYARLRRGSSQLYLGSNGSAPISSVVSDIDQNSSFPSTGRFIVTLYTGNIYPMSYSSSESSTITYKIPTITSIENQGTDYDGTYDTHGYIAHYNSTGSSISYFTSDISREDIHLQSDTWYSFPSYNDRTYTATVSGDDSGTVYLDNGTVPSGTYCLQGFFDFPSGQVANISDIFTGTGSVEILNSSDQLQCEVDDLSFYFGISRNDLVNTTQIAYTVTFTIPSDFHGSSSDMLRLQLHIDTVAGKTVTPVRFGVSTGAFVLPENPNSIASLTYSVGSWFSGIGSELRSVLSFLRKEDSDASQAASHADNQAVSEASSAIQEVHQFESDLNTNISSSVSQINFTVPSSSGFLGAMGAITVIMGSIFENLGAYQFIITIPLILGILLLLLGRGMSTLGNIRKAPEDPYQEWLKGWKK